MRTPSVSCVRVWKFAIRVILDSREEEKELFLHFTAMGAYIEEAAIVFSKLAEDLLSARNYAQKIHSIEHACDREVNAISQLLDTTSFFTIDHVDLQKLAGLGDSIVDLFWKAANRIGNTYELTDPLDADPELKEVAEILQKECVDVKNIFANLRTPKRMPNLQQITRDFDQKEHRADELKYSVIKRRFNAAMKSWDNFPVCRWIAWEEIHTDLETISDICVDITDLLGHFRHKYWRW